VIVAPEPTYIIRGGLEGRERLRLVTRVMVPSTTELLDRVEVAHDADCLDVGCGGGDVTLELARRAHAGRVVGVDLDEAKLEIARAEAREAGADNIAYRCQDLRNLDLGSAYDVVHARFVLSHLADPQAAVDGLVRMIRPGGALIVVDIEKTATLCEPPHPSFKRYIELYTLAARARGVDPDIGPQLPAMLAAAGCQHVRVNIVQPVGRQPQGYEGNVKLTAPVTLESIADAILALDIAERSELDSLVDDLYRLAADDETLISTPRMFQAWGQRPARPG
jgi:ubiquinone/menaquinone biosynthesis C-methylase UbiE